MYKIGIIEAKTRFFWMTMTSSKNVDGVLELLLKDNFPWMRAQHGLKGFKFQADNGETDRNVCKALVAALGGILITNCPYSPETMPIIERSWGIFGEIVFLQKFNFLSH